MSWTTRAMMMALAVIGAMAAQPATAAEPERIGRNGDWTAFTLPRGGGKVCYMASSPTKAEGRLRQAWRRCSLLVTH